MALNVIVCHELPVVRDGLCSLLQGADINVVENTSSGRHVLALLRSTRVDVIITGMRLSELSGAELIRRLGHVEIAKRPRAVAYEVQDDAAVIAELLHAGAFGLLTDDASRGELESAVRAASRGDSLLAPRIANRLVEWFREQDTPPEELPEPAMAGLTPREQEVLLRTARGSSADDVARQLSIGVATVRTHLYRLRCKLHVDDRAQLVAYAYRSGLMRTALPPVVPSPRSKVVSAKVV